MSDVTVTGDLVTAHALLARVRRWLETDGDDDLGQIERDIVGYLDGVPAPRPDAAVVQAIIDVVGPIEPGELAQWLERRAADQRVLDACGDGDPRSRHWAETVSAAELARRGE